MKFRTAIIDTNVVVAGLLTHVVDSPTARILDAMLEAGFVYLLSTELVAEYRQVLWRPVIRKLHRLTSTQIDQILVKIVTNAVIREPACSSTTAPEPGDQHLWDLMACEPGTVLVTGDRKLVKTPPDGASVLSPAAFVEQM